MKSKVGPFIERRNLLRGAGMALSIPVFESLNVGFAASPGSDKPRRLICIGNHLGFWPDGFFPTIEGSDYVQEKILGYRPPPPPPDVPLIEADASGAKTIREQLAMHRDNATCASCHRKIDPFGFPLENFDAIGIWRENYSKSSKIDSSCVLPSGEKFAGVTDFRKLIIAQHNQFTRSLTEKLLTYALGREPALADRANIDAIMEDLSSNKGGFKDLIRAVVLSKSFRKN